jgi:signal transduction histidine kinase
LPELLSHKAEAKHDADDRSTDQSIDDDGDLDIPWQNLRQTDQSIEWFDAKQQLISRTGKHFPTGPLNFHLHQQGAVRILSFPVYAEAGKQGQVRGYVRVSELIKEEQGTLHQLVVELGWGSLLGSLLITGSGWYLTRRSLQPIEQNVRQLKQFTADASHELRNPLTVIKTTVEVMQSHPERIHAGDIGKLESIHQATAQMSQLVDDLLLLARSDSTGTVSNQLLIPLDELLEDLIEALQPQAATKQIQLIGSMPINSSIRVRGDASQLRRLFANLLDNALDYTPPQGKVQVTVVVTSISIIVKVQDTGIGIAPEHIPLIFDRFWRADQARSQRDGGAGLGLAIAQTIAQAHGGEISVTSQLNVGSCFQVRLPLA